MQQHKEAWVNERHAGFPAHPTQLQRCGAGKRDEAVPGGTLGAGENCGTGVTSDEGEEGFQCLSLCFGEGGAGRCV